VSAARAAAVDLHVPKMELRIVDENGRRLLARFDEGPPMLIGEGYLMSMGAFSNGGRIHGPPAFRNPYKNDEDPAFHRAADEARLKDHFKRRLWGTLVEAYFISGCEKNDAEREKTLSTIRRMWDDPVKNWWPGNERLRWAGLAPESSESHWK
jgi:hypothetical protein